VRPRAVSPFGITDAAVQRWHAWRHWLEVRSAHAMLSECISDRALFRIRIVRGFPIDRATINARSSPIIGTRLEW